MLDTEGLSQTNIAKYLFLSKTTVMKMYLNLSLVEVKWILLSKSRLIKFDIAINFIKYGFSRIEYIPEVMNLKSSKLYPLITFKNHI